MIAYARPVDEAECRMAFLQEALDDPTAAPCGRCDVCAGPWYSADVPEAAAEAASAALDRPGVELAPRAQWPTGADRLGVDVKGKIAPSDQLETGRAVARLTDLGWGQRLRTLLGDDGVGGVVTLDLEAPGIEEDPDAAFDVPGRGARSSDVPPDDELLRACARVLGVLGLEGAPRRGRRDAVAPPAAAGDRPGAGAGPAGPAALPGRDVPAARRPDRSARAATAPSGWPRCGSGSSSATELRERLAAAGSAPVLLVDDLADSRWTMTVAGRELRRAGAAAVLPFALALTA